MPTNIEFSEDAPDNGGIDFLEDQEVAKFAITAPQEVANTVMRTLTSPAVGESAQEARDYSARERAAEKILTRPMGGGAMDMPYVGPETAAQLRSAAGAVGRAIEAPLAGMARAATQVVDPRTFLPEEEQAKLRPFVITERDRAPGEPAELRPMTRQEAEIRAPLQPGVPLYRPRGTELEPEGSDLERLLSQNSTPGAIAMIAGGGVSKVIGASLLASMVPGVVEDIADVAAGGGSMEQKRDKINQLLVPAFLALKHGGGFRGVGEAVRDLPPPIRRGIQPVPDARGRYVTPEGERRILAPEIIDEPAPITTPLQLTGAELPGRPAGFAPAVATAGPVELGPAAPPRVRRPEVPEVGEVQARESMLEEIRRKDARTRAQIMEVFPDLTREQAAELRNAVWGKPGADVGVEVSPTIPRPEPMRPPRPTVKAPEPAPDEFAAEQEARRAEEARQAAIDRSNLEQGIITQQRLLEDALAKGDVRGQEEATRKLMALRKAYEGPPEPVKPPIQPKPPTPRLPRGTFAPEVPGTPAEVREPIVQEIQRRNLRTKEQILDAFPSLREQKNPRQAAAELRDKAWGKEQPPEKAGPYGMAPEAGKPIAIPPEAKAAADKLIDDRKRRALGEVPTDELIARWAARRDRLMAQGDFDGAREAMRAIADLEAGRKPAEPKAKAPEGKPGEEPPPEEGQAGAPVTKPTPPEPSAPAAAPKSLEETSLSDFNKNLDKFLDDQGIPRNSWPTDLREKVFSLLKEDAIKNRDELNTLLEQVEGAEALQEMGLMPKPTPLPESARARLMKKVARMPKEKLDSPHDLEPALMVEGEPVSGGEDHNDIFNKIISEEGVSDSRTGEAFDALKDDARHVFVDKEGRIYSREQAAKALGETEPLQSRRLRELQKNTPKPGAKAAEAGKEPAVTVRAPISDAEEAINEHVNSWKWPIATRPGDPKIGDVFEMEDGRQRILTKIWRTATAKDRFGKLHLVWMWPKHPSELKYPAHQLGEDGPKDLSKLGKKVGNIYTDRGLDIPAIDWRKNFIKAEEDLPPDRRVGPEIFEDEAKAIEAETSAKAAEGIEGTVIAGKTLAEWEAVTDTSGLPKGTARAELAKWLAVPNQPSKILQALKNKKRTREIHAPPATEVKPESGTEEMKYGVPLSQWEEMANYTDAEQIKRWGTTRARLMEAAATGGKPTKPAEDTGKEFPVANQHGVYSKEDAETIATNFKGKGRHGAEIHVMEVAPGKWIASSGYQTSTSGASSPLTTKETFPTRLDALANEFSDLKATIESALERSDTDATKRKQLSQIWDWISNEENTTLGSKAKEFQNNYLRRRIQQAENAIAQLESTIDNFKKRGGASEEDFGRWQSLIKDYYDRIKKWKDQLSGKKEGATAPKAAEPTAPAGDTPRARLTKAFDDWDQGESNLTERDLLAMVEQEIEDNPDAIPEGLKKAAEDYRKALIEDQEMAGRGDIEGDVQDFIDELERMTQQGRAAIIHGDTAYVGGTIHAQTLEQMIDKGILPPDSTVPDEARKFVTADFKTVTDQRQKPLAKQPKKIVDLSQLPKVAPKAEGHPLDQALKDLGIKGKGRMDLGIYITPGLTEQQFTDMVTLADRLGYTTTGEYSTKGKKIFGEFKPKATESEAKIRSIERQISTLEGMYEEFPDLNKDAPEAIARLKEQLAELKKPAPKAPPEKVEAKPPVSTTERDPRLNPEMGDVIDHPDFGRVEVKFVVGDRVRFEILSGKKRGKFSTLPLKEWQEDLGAAPPPPEPGAPDPRRAALTEAGLDAFDLDRLARITGMSQDQWLDQTTIEKNHDAAIYAADKPRLLAMEEAIDEKDTRKVRALWDASFPPDHFVRRLFQAITKAKDPFEWGKTLEGKAPEAEPSQEWKDKVGLKGPIRPAPSKEMRIPPPVEVQGELYEFTPEEVKKANLACRVCGAVGAGAITPKYVQRTSSRTETILDFGAGDQAPHTKTMRQDGFNVTAYEFGQNVVEGIHDPNALERKYDTVFASNVLNVQSGRPMLRATLKEIFDATGGRAVFNYPRKPRYSSLSTTEVAKEIEDIFGVAPTRVGGTPDAPIWEVRTDGKAPTTPSDKAKAAASTAISPKSYRTAAEGIPPELTAQHAELTKGIEDLKKQIERTNREPFSYERNERINEMRRQGQELQDKLRLVENRMFDLKWQAETDQFRGQVEPPPSEPKITSKELRTQKESLLEQIDQAIKEAPDVKTEPDKTPRIKISVPDDGDFSIYNTKDALKKFREMAKGFPSTVEKSVAKVGGTQVSTTKSGKPTPIPATVEPKTPDRNKILGRLTSDDPTREGIQTVYSDGTQMIATDGRRLIRYIGKDMPGTPAEPVRLSPEGKPQKETSNFANYNTILSGTPRLVLGGMDTANFWHVAHQANTFNKTFGDKGGSVELYLNPDRTLGAKLLAEGDSFEHNVQKGSKYLGRYNPEYLFDMADTARRLGDAKADLYVDGEEGPLELVGKNHQHLLMAMRISDKPNRANPTTIPATVSGKAEYVRPAPGLPPLQNPESALTEKVGPYRVTLEGGEFLIEKPAVNKYESDLEIARVPLGDQNRGDLAKALSKFHGEEITPNDKRVANILNATGNLAKEREGLLEEGRKRLKDQKLPPGLSEGPGAASPAEFGRDRPSSEGIDVGNDAWNRAIRYFDNFLDGMRQLFTRSGLKQDFSQLANAADNIPRMFAQQKGNALRIRMEKNQGRAVTFLMQALKMSGDGLSVDDAARLGELQFQGDPRGYLRTKQTDLETKAQEFLAKGQKLEATAAKEAAEAMALAQKQYNTLLPIARLAKSMLDAQWAREQRNGIPVDYERWYVPQRHDLDLLTSADKPIVLGHSRGSGVASGFKKAKFYEDYATAIENGFIPRSTDIADLVEHRVFQGERLIERKALFKQLAKFNDPTDGKPVVTRIPRRVIHRPDGTIDVQETTPIGYEIHEVTPGDRVAIHSGYARLIRALTGSSQLGESAVVGTLADMAAVQKHISLAIDTFHASRTLQAELALTGKMSIGDRQRRGLALVEYRPQDLNLAAQKGLITQEMADWVQKPQELQIGGRTVRLSPHAMITLGARNGLNMARVADVMYRDWIRELPMVGDVQKWVFDKMTRSAISLSFLHEFERVARANPHLNAEQVARGVASDINTFFGNLGKESIFKNPSMRTFNNILFLAPQWVEALARREARAVAQTGKTVIDAFKGEPIRVGTAAKGIGTGLAAYFVATQLVNLWTRGHLTFFNPEEGHKFDAYIPPLLGGKQGTFISPLSVFGEIMHDIIRYSYDKPDLATAIAQIGENKFGNVGRFFQVLGTGRDPLTSEKLIGTTRRALKAGMQLVPVPIVASQTSRLVQSQLFPGKVQEPTPAGLMRQYSASAGFKTEIEPTASQQVRRMAEAWKRGSKNPTIRAQIDRRLKEDFGPSDYRDLRASLANNNMRAAEAAYAELLETKKPEDVRQAMAHPHPFTGSANMEAVFRSQLTPEQMRTYRAAIAEREALNRKFHDMLRDYYRRQRTR